MKRLKLLLSLSAFLLFVSCTEHSYKKIDETQITTVSVIQPEITTVLPFQPQIILEYFYTAYANEDDYMVAEKPPQDYLTQSLLTDERLMFRYFVKLYETDYSEEELIEKAYPLSDPAEMKHLPEPMFTTTLCPNNEIPIRLGESNFLPEGSKVYTADPYLGSYYSYNAVAVYDTDDGKKMTILRATMYQCSDDYPVPVPFGRTQKAAYIESVGYFSPYTRIPPNKFLAARYYSDSADTAQAKLDEILKDAEYVGEIKKEISRNMYVDNDSESNFLPEGTKIYTVGEEGIAVLPEPILHEDSGRYIVAVRLFKSGSEIDSAEARKLVE